MHWEQKSDALNCAVSELITRNRFDKILSYFHLGDNSNLDEYDKFAKVRPFYILANKEVLQAFQLDEQLCVNESMLPYFGRHSTK